jgi:uncharacterized protein (TIGR03086 family)
VAVADRILPTGLLVSAAALEITVHGWDVARATGLDHEIPDDLAQALLAVAREVVVADDRVERFAAPTPCAPGAGAPTRLLAFLGRT